jgi:hypothetical protein
MLPQGHRDDFRKETSRMAGFRQCRCDPIQRAFSLTTSSHPPFPTTEQLKKGSNESASVGKDSDAAICHVRNWLSAAREGRGRSGRQRRGSFVRGVHTPSRWEPLGTLLGPCILSQIAVLDYGKRHTVLVDGCCDDVTVDCAG